MAWPRLHLGVCLMPVEAEQRWARKPITQLTSAVHQSGYCRMLNGYFHFHWHAVMISRWPLITFQQQDRTGQLDQKQKQVSGNLANEAQCVKSLLVFWSQNHCFNSKNRNKSHFKSKLSQNNNSAQIWEEVKDSLNQLTDWNFVKHKSIVENQSRQSHWLESIISYN